ncbi:MAG: GIY-YIG nuclease family protein [Aestuariivirgaceae bacterium]|nr:GIY-YIG nuclease family protein [Aestuariivirgaceae bacterium]
MAQPCVYMLANKFRGTLQMGVTANLAELVAEKKARTMAGETADASVLLVWSEDHAQMATARLRMEELQRLSRDFKFGLIERKNPSWRDLHVPPALKPAYKPTLRRLPLSARQFL